MAPPRGGMGPASAIQVQVKRLDYSSTGGQYPHQCGKCGAHRIDAQIGLEPTPEAYVATMVGVMREVWRVLKDDGTVWLNLGDSYAHNGACGGGSPVDVRKAEYGRGTASGKWEGREEAKASQANMRVPAGLKPKDLCGMPWRVAFALQADGWYLRSDIVWAKPNPMPESVTDRPTRSHEYIFLLSKSATYFCDMDAIREDFADSSIERLSQPSFLSQHGGPKDYGEGSNRSARKALENLHARMPANYHGSLFTNGKTAHHGNEGQGPRYEHSGRNRRDVWWINSQPVRDAHFATFPEKLVEPCILAGTSERGECVRCGKNWVRVTEDTPDYAAFKNGRGAMRRSDLEGYGLTRGTSNPSVTRSTLTTGWRPQCACDAPTRPNLCLDPFLGSGTVGRVSERFGRRWVGLDLSTEYHKIAKRRTAQMGLRL